MPEARSKAMDSAISARCSRDDRGEEKAGKFPKLDPLRFPSSCSINQDFSIGKADNRLFSVGYPRSGGAHI